MSNAILAQSITRPHVGQALRALRQSCQYRARELNAINKAALELEAARWQYDGEALIIESRTLSGVRYHVQHDGCDCPAGTHGRPCWHRSALTLIQRAAELALTPPTAARSPRPHLSDQQYAAVCAAADDLFA